jgi:drug/metabolite transporter (DMT)-like permease
MLLVVVASWGLVWPVNKALLETLSPYWLGALRAAIATVVLFAIAIARGNLVAPTRGDLPIVASIALLHMAGFVVLSNIGLALVTTGRAVVLAYTTPLWVTPAAAILLGERLTARRVCGIAIGLLGLIVLFNPLAFDWGDRRAVLGNLAILTAALLWAANIVHLRGHTWRATPFELVPWEMLLATVVLVPVALVSGPLPTIAWTASTIVLLGYSSVVANALAYWAMAVAGRELPAMTTALGLLATPILSIVVATSWLGERITASLMMAVVLVLGGIALGTTATRASGAIPRGSGN